MKLLLALLIPFSLYSKSVSEVGGMYYFKYEVLGKEGAFEEITWEFEKFDFDQYWRRFGLEEKHGETISIAPGELDGSHFKVDHGTIYLNFTKIIGDSLDFTKPIYERIRNDWQ